MTIATERVEIPVDGDMMGGCLARPEGEGPFPAVVVYMEIFGVNEHIRDVTGRLAEEGFLAVAPDFFHRTGPGVELGYDDDGMARGMTLLGQLDADEMIADARATLAWLRARPDVRGERIGAMGFCIGGHMAYLTACETDVAASAAFYGGGIAAPSGPGGKKGTLERTGGIQGRLVCFFGEQDALIPRDQVDSIRAALERHGVRHDVVVYPGADHGFFCDQRATWQKEAAEDAWARTLQLFADELRER